MYRMAANISLYARLNSSEESRRRGALLLIEPGPWRSAGRLPPTEVLGTLPRSVLTRNAGSVRRKGYRPSRTEAPTAGSGRVGGGVSLEPSRLLLEQFRRLDQVGPPTPGSGWRVLAPSALASWVPTRWRRVSGMSEPVVGPGGPLTGWAAGRSEQLGTTGHAPPFARSTAALHGTTSALLRTVTDLAPKGDVRPCMGSRLTTC
jgi:hypothetical protein